MTLICESFVRVEAVTEEREHGTGRPAQAVGLVREAKATLGGGGSARKVSARGSGRGGSAMASGRVDGLRRGYPDVEHAGLNGGAEFRGLDRPLATPLIPGSAHVTLACRAMVRRKCGSLRASPTGLGASA